MDGGSSDVKKVGKYRIEPFLKAKGVGTLDYALVSHGDSDHMNGIEELLERQEVGVRIRTLVLPEKCFWDEHLERLAEKAQHNGVRVIMMTQGDVLKQGELFITCLSPSKKVNIEKGNAASMVFAVQCGKFDMLLTGDVENTGEDMLVDLMKEKCLQKRVEVLKVAHHGSRNSTGESFLKVVRPYYAVISAGEGNRYGHPHQETIDRLSKVDSKICCTKECGAVTFSVEESGVSIEKYVE